MSTENAEQYEIDREASLYDIYLLCKSLERYSSSRGIYDGATIAGRVKDHITKFPEDERFAEANRKTPAELTVMTFPERDLYEHLQSAFQTDFRDDPDVWNAIVTPDSFGMRNIKEFSHNGRKSLRHIASLKKRLPPSAMQGGALMTYEMVTMGQIRPRDWPRCEELTKAVRIHNATYSIVEPNLATDSVGDNVRYAPSKAIFSGRDVVLNNQFNLNNLYKQQAAIVADLNTWVAANVGMHTMPVIRSLPSQDITNILNNYLVANTISGAVSYNEALILTQKYQ